MRQVFSDTRHNCIVLAYLATKSQFLNDAPIIEDKISDSVLKNFNLKVGPREFESWRNSLGNNMAHVVRDSRIPDDALVAIEYRLNGRGFRLDFVLGGLDERGNEAVTIIELKQWTEVQLSEKSEHVITRLGGGLQETRHPSYQAWSYKSHLELYNEYVYSNPVSVSACAYLHNCVDGSKIKESRYEEYLSQAPVFLHGEYGQLQDLLANNIRTGIGTTLMERIDGSPIRPSRQLADAVGEMLAGKSEFVLLDEQKTVYETILSKARNIRQTGKQVLIIKGGPGTGKSVISINALAQLTSERMNVKYVTANAAPRDVFQAKLKGILKGDAIKLLFSGSGSFTETPRDSIDVLIVDEAHRLRMKSGMFSHLGENQTREIIKTAGLSIFFIDEAQKVTWKDVGEISRIRESAAIEGADVTILELISQFRCGGSDDYLAWLDDSLGVQEIPNNYFTRDKFDFRIFENPSDLHSVIREKNLENNKSRVVAGYCWNWISKKDRNAFDFDFPEFNYQAKWNLTEYGNEWIMSPASINEVGCIHTCQGLEVDFIGVIVGGDLAVRNGKLVTIPSGRAKSDKSLDGYKKERKTDPEAADLRADKLIRNTYRTLMSRGMKGCYVYFVDPEVRKYFESRLPN